MVPLNYCFVEVYLSTVYLHKGHLKGCGKIEQELRVSHPSVCHTCYNAGETKKGPQMKTLDLLGNNQETVTFLRLQPSHQDILFAVNIPADISKIDM